MTLKHVISCALIALKAAVCHLSAGTKGPNL